MLKGFSLKYKKNTFLKLKRFITLSFIFLILPTDINAENKEYLSGINNFPKNEKNNNLESNSQYLLGAGDELYVLLKSLPEYSGYFFIDPDGTINLPGLTEKISIESLTVTEAKNILLKKYKEFVIDPQLSVFISTYRPITVYVRGEVASPGLYTLRGSQKILGEEFYKLNEPITKNITQMRSQNEIIGNNFATLSRGFSPSGFPTVYDVLRVSNGITPYSDLTSITVVRKNNISNGGGKIMTKLNFLKLFKEGDLSQNIRVFDQDVINIAKSKKVLTEQLVEANRSNLSPSSFQVLVTGNVVKKGLINVPKGASLNQAIEIAGREKLLSGNIKFLRYDESGIIDKRSFSLNRSAKHNSFKNPILRDGDVIHVSRSLVGTSSDFLREVVSPIVNSYTIYKIFTD